MIRHRHGGLKLPRPREHQRVLGRGLVDEVADPRVPAGLDLGGVEVVLGVLDPAGAQGQLLVVLEELVAGAVLADQGAGFGVAEVLGGLSKAGRIFLRFRKLEGKGWRRGRYAYPHLHQVVLLKRKDVSHTNALTSQLFPRKP